jgi:hypothetical protein
MNKSKVKVEESKVKDDTSKSISTRNIIPPGPRQFSDVDKKHWVNKLKEKTVDKEVKK